MENIKVDLVLEIADLLKYDRNTSDMEVDKSIFDDFEEGKVIYVKFADDMEDLIYEYKMISEDYDGIKMDCLCAYED